MAAVRGSLVGHICRQRPLLFLSLPGLLLMILGLLIGLAVVGMVGQQQGVPLGPAALSAVCVTAGLILSLTGVLLHAVATLPLPSADEVYLTRRHAPIT
jgi:hypothetical protein